MTVNTMLEDEREIEYIESNTIEGWCIRVGRNAVTRIVPYREAGELNYVTWLAVYQGDFLWERVDSRGLTVRYKGGKHRA